MRYQITVFGAGSLVGKSLCRRAVRLGWDVNAYSIEDIRPQKKNYRRQIFYNDDLNWRQHITWNASYNYDGKLDRLHDEMKNCTGVVYLHEPTPLLLSKKVTFEDTAIKLAKLCADWSVRHYICVEDILNGATISEDAENEIGDIDDYLIVSLIRANRIYSYDSLSTCLKVFQNRTFRSMGINTPQLDAINSETIAKAITTLIHDSSDTNCYRILDKMGVEAYLTSKNIKFDTPEEQTRMYDIDSGKDDDKEEYGSIKYGYDKDDDDDNDNDEEEDENDDNDNNNNNNNNDGGNNDKKNDKNLNSNKHNLSNNSLNEKMTQASITMNGQIANFVNQHKLNNNSIATGNEKYFENNGILMNKLINNHSTYHRWHNFYHS